MRTIDRIEKRRKKPSTRRDSTPRPQEFCSSGVCSTAVLYRCPCLGLIYFNDEFHFFRCDICSAVFLSKAGLKMHLVLLHDKDKRNVFRPLDEASDEEEEEEEEEETSRLG